MSPICRKVLVLWIASAFFMGCATTGTRTASDSEATDDVKRTKTEGAVGGAVIGGVVGGIIGAAIGGKKGTAVGIAAGAAMGGGAGYALGSTVASRKQKYANEEDRLNGELAMAMQYNHELRDYNAQTQSRISTLVAEISNLKSRYGSGVVKVKELERKQEDINHSIHDGEQRQAGMNKELAALNEYLGSVKQTHEQTKVAKLEQEVSQLRANIEMLDSNNRQMAKMVDSLGARR